MSTKDTDTSTTPSTQDDRLFPAEDAYPPQREKAAWRGESDASAGYVEEFLAQHCDHPDCTFEDVTSS